MGHDMLARKWEILRMQVRSKAHAWRFPSLFEGLMKIYAHMHMKMIPKWHSSADRTGAGPLG